MQISRRGALLGASAAAVTGLTVAPLARKAAGVKAALASADYPQLGYIQALVSDLRKVTEIAPMCVFVAFQETADRLEALPGIVPVPNEMWFSYKARVSKERVGPYLTAGRIGP